MSPVRDQLRVVAQEFADRIYDMFRAELLMELRQELADQEPLGGGRPPTPGVAGRAAAGPWASQATSTALARVVSYTQEHPGVRPKELVRALSINHRIVLDALAAACVSDVLVKQGSGPRARFFPGSRATLTLSDAMEPARRPSGRSGRRRGESTPTSTDVVAQVSVFVSENPGCRHGDIAAVIGVSSGVLAIALRKARERGTIRMVGQLINARYFPQNPSAKDTRRTARRSAPASEE